MRMFGFLEVNIEDAGIRLALGVRNSHDKTFALGLTVGYRVFVCDNLAFHGDFMAVSRKHSKKMDVQEVIALGVDRAERACQADEGRSRRLAQPPIDGPSGEGHHLRRLRH